MMLRKRRKGRTAQALDALVGVTKVWSELKIGKKAGQGVAKVKKARLPWLKIAGGAAVAGAVGAAVARKLKGDSAPVYTGPAPSEAVEAAKSAPDPPPPLAVAPDPEPDAGIPAAGSSALRDGGDGDAPSDAEPAAGAEGLREEPAEPAGADEPAAAEEQPVVADEPETEAAEPAADEESDKP